ncbi:MAG TPA: NmrA family NAD(P)-binding protein, partial [Streptosporangiaceae bacterium]|nr:NmrA family NAD(P)-binding protein [Streptosporangiaceae bacterium]
GHPVRALVRDPGKASRLFGQASGVEIHQAQFADPVALAKGLAGARTVFPAMGSIGGEADLQRAVIRAVASGSDFQQLVRLSVLNAGPDSLGINQRGHWSIDSAAQAADLPYTTIRPSIWTSSILAGAPEIRARRTWTGLADTGRVALSHPGDTIEVAIRVLNDPSTWGQHHELTGSQQLTWPGALQILSGELGEKVTFRTAGAYELLRRLIKAGVAPGMAELLITREWAIMAGENERTTTTVRDLTGHEPRTVEEFMHENRDSFR